MEIKIYVDILFLTNLFMDYALLLLSAKIVKRKPKLIKLLLSSLFGALYSVISFFMPLSFPESLINIVVGAIMTIIAFTPRSFISFIKHTCIFFAVSFCLGGISFALLSYTGFGSRVGAVFSGSTLYLNIPIYKLIFACAVCYGILSIFNRSVKKYRKQADMIYDVTVTYNEKSITFKAMFDSGNSLLEPKSGLSVLICQKKTLKPLICCDNMKTLTIPYKSISGNGEMQGFIPDKTEINGKTFKLCIGISDIKLGETFDAILPLDFYERTD